MAQPTPYNRVVSFTTIQQEAPSDELPGDSLDAELNAVKQTLDETLNNLTIIQRDDGQLANESVGREQLQSNIQLGFNAPQAWAPDVSYTTLDTTFFEAIFYSCIVSHVSSSDFASDLSDGKWEVIADFAGAVGAAINLEVTPAGNLSSTNAQDAFEELQGDIDTINALAMLADPAIAPSTPSTADSSTKVATTAMVHAAIVAVIFPGFGPVPYTGLTEPTGWCFANGQTFLKSAEPALWDYAKAEADAGNTLWSYDATHLTVPSMKGLIPIGKDNMGGTTAANRITSAGSGLDGATFGAIGGAQNVTLTTAQIPAHAHTGLTGVENQAHTHNYDGTFAGGISWGPGQVVGSLGRDAAGTGTTATENQQHNHSFTTDNNAGGGGAHSNVQPGVITNYLYKK